MSAAVQTEIDLSGEFHYAVLLRHGESTWNKEVRFTGWANPSLSPKGVQEAISAGQSLKKFGVKFDEVHSSDQWRANLTAVLALLEAEQPELIAEMRRVMQLRERCYGGLTGLNKKETAAVHGEEQVFLWRRGFDEELPSGEYEGVFYKGETLKGTIARVWPYVEENIKPVLEQGKNVLISAHGNSLRGIVRGLGVRDDDSILDTELVTGVPLVFKFNKANEIVDAFFLTQEEGHKPFELPSKPFVLPWNRLEQ